MKRGQGRGLEAIKGVKKVRRKIGHSSNVCRDAHMQQSSGRMKARIVASYIYWRAVGTSLNWLGPARVSLNQYPAE